MAQTIPNLFIIGPPRTGTTSMAKWVSSHPGVAGGLRKEPMFHASDLPSPLSVDLLEEYLGMWAGAEASPIRLEASPWYLFSREAAKSIAHLSPDARLIVHLRDPVDLLASLHTHHVFLDFEDQRDFESAVFSDRPADPKEFRRNIEYLEVVRLGVQTRRFLEQFAEDRFSFVDFEALSSDPESTYFDLLDDLGLDRVPLSSYPHMNRARQQRLPGANQRFADTSSIAGRGIGKVVRKLNTTSGRPPVDPLVRRRIIERLEPDIDELATLIERDLTDWKSV
jgi:hypothetical protein